MNTATAQISTDREKIVTPIRKPKRHLDVSPFYSWQDLSQQDDDVMPTPFETEDSVSLSDGNTDADMLETYDSEDNIVPFSEEFHIKCPKLEPGADIDRNKREPDPADMFDRDFQGKLLTHLLRCPELAPMRKEVASNDFFLPIHQIILRAAKELDEMSGTTVPIPCSLLKPVLGKLIRTKVALEEEEHALVTQCQDTYKADLHPVIYERLLPHFMAQARTRRLMNEARDKKINDPGQLIEKLVEIQRRSHSSTQRPTLRKPSEILAMRFPAEDKILENGYLTKGESLLICGAPGLGKSRLSRQLAMDSVLGRDFLGITTNGRNTRWLIIQMEDSNQRLQSELEAMMRGLTREERQRVDDQILIHTLENDEDGFLQIGAMMRDGKRDMRAIHAIDGLVREAQPDVVIFDCFARFGAGNLNDDSEMAFVAMELLRLTKQGNPKRVPVFVHHARTGKDAAAGAVGYNRGSHGRNSKALLGIIRAQINLAPGSPDDNSTLVVSSGKLNNGVEFAPFAVTLNPLDLRYEPDSCFNMAAWQAEVQGGPSQGSRKTVDDLLACIPQEGNVEKDALININAPGRGIGVNKASALLKQLLAEGQPRVFEERVPRPHGRPQLFISRRPPEAPVTQE